MARVKSAGFDRTASRMTPGSYETLIRISLRHSKSSFRGGLNFAFGLVPKHACSWSSCCISLSKMSGALPHPERDFVLITDHGAFTQHGPRPAEPTRNQNRPLSQPIGRLTSRTGTDWHVSLGLILLLNGMKWLL